MDDLLTKLEQQEITGAENVPLRDLVDRLRDQQDLSDDDFAALIECGDERTFLYMAREARKVRETWYGKDVYLRGLIELSNYCKNDCLYCGIRRGNANCKRYRLTPEQILDCADQGYRLGFKTVVLQGGEDPFYTDNVLEEVIRGIKTNHSDCAVTLSMGERSDESYRRLFEAGADRYLLRHETADKTHYERLHPKEMSFENRIRCLHTLKEIGYQVGCGMMIGSPYQETAHLVSDLRFLKKLQPDMVGMGPFIPHKDTRFRDEQAGSVEMTLRLLSIVRLLLPQVLLPATTALGTLDPFGREKGILAGCNVVMPNLSPTDVRDKYLLYDNKICTGDEAAESVRSLSLRISKTGYRVVFSRGDHIRQRPDTEEEKI